MVSGAALESDTIPAIPATGAAEGDQPAVLFRCEDGRLGVYLVPGDSGDENVEAQLVPVTLDSTPSC